MSEQDKMFVKMAQLAELRKKISETLIKWSLPTRQVVINDLIQLFNEYSKKMYEMDKPENK